MFIPVHCTTNTKKFGYVFDGSGLKAKLKSMARKGKANKELVSRFKKVFKAPVHIALGMSQHNKIMFVEGKTVQQVKELLQ